MSEILQDSLIQKQSIPYMKALSLSYLEGGGCGIILKGTFPLDPMPLGYTRMHCTILHTIAYKLACQAKREGIQGTLVEIL